MTPKPYVLAIDPGVASGVALLSLDGPRVLAAEELTWEETHDFVHDTLRRYDPHEIALVVERFVVIEGPGKKSFQPASLEIIGMCRSWARQYGLSPATLQTVADAKGIFGNPVLRRLGCYHRGGEGHANDAIRHALLYFFKHGWVDLRMLPED